MKARAGDRVAVTYHRLGDVPRHGEIVEVQGDDGTPPYLVRWDADGHESLLFPGPDVRIEHRPAKRGEDS